MKLSLYVAAASLLLAPALAMAQPGVDDAQDPVAQQPSPPPAAQPAPQNEDWSNVSHINGHPVPVGERNDYLVAFKRTNISSNPIGWMVGFYGLSVSEAVTDHVVIRGDVNMINFASSSGYEAGLSMPLYLKRAYSGPFIEPGVVVRSLTHTDSYDMSSTTETIAGPEMLVGYHVTFDSGFNIAAALGIARNINTSANQDQYQSSDANIEPVGYFRVGYAF